MQVIENENIVMYDVDDTLVMWDPGYYTSGPYSVAIKCPYDGKSLFVKPHEPHIELLKTHKARGKAIIVWSQGGYAWAKAVVEALELTAYVDLIMSKPTAYVDDLPVGEWLTQRTYIKPESNWRKNRA